MSICVLESAKFLSLWSYKYKLLSVSPVLQIEVQNLSGISQHLTPTDSVIVGY